MKLCLLLISLLSLSSCSIFFRGQDGPKTAKGSSYTITYNQPDWVYKKNERSDYIYENMKDGRILLSNSFCEEFQEQPLDQLANKTFKTVKHFKSNISKYTTFQDREAYHLEGMGQVDGVKVTLRLLNTRRNNCYFDFVAIIPEKVSDADAAFDKFLKTVVFR
jgi:hypothetical protein